MRSTFAVVLALTVSLPFTFARAAPPTPAGVVKYTTGEVSIVRNGQIAEAAVNSLLYQGDMVKTGSDGKAGLILEDDTVISMGRKSRLVLTRFLFQSEGKEQSLIIKLLRGTAAFIAGQIAKLAPNAMRIQTPQAVIGVRGSHVLVEVD